MKKQTLALLTCGAACGLTISAIQPAHAQRERADRQEQRQERSQRVENMTPEQRQQVAQQRLQNMTPEARQQMEQRMQQMRAQREADRWNWVKQALTASGFTDAAGQDAVIALIKKKETGLQALQEQARQLATKLTDATVQSEAFSTELKTFRDAVAKYEEGYKADLAKFDTTYKYSTQPRLETVLTVLGVIGNETTTLGGLGQVFPNSPFGRGGFGRGAQGGGPGGGRGN